MFPKPIEKAIFYEDSTCYACLATHPLSHGHSVVVWKKDIKDLHLLSKRNYEHLMNVVDAVRSALLKELGIEKAYLVYMDEAKHVHWHIVPRYSEMGYNVFHHEPGEIKRFDLVAPLRKRLDISAKNL